MPAQITKVARCRPVIVFTTVCRSLRLKGTHAARVSAEGPGGTAYRVEGQRIIFDNVPVLPPRQAEPANQITYRVIVKAIAAGDVRFAVELNSDQLDSPVNETESTHQY